MQSIIDLTGVTHAGCPEVCQSFLYDAVILTPRQHQKDAFSLKVWLEQNVQLYHGSGKHRPRIELMGNIRPESYAGSLEIVAQQTQTVILYCVKGFDRDTEFKQAMDDLWPFKSKGLRLFPLLVNYDNEETLPMCIPVSAAHPLQWENRGGCHFRDAMIKLLSSTLEKRLNHDERRRVCEHQRNIGRESRRGFVGLRSSKPPRCTCEESEQLSQGACSTSPDSGFSSALTTTYTSLSCGAVSHISSSAGLHDLRDLCTDKETETGKETVYGNKTENARLHDSYVHMDGLECQGHSTVLPKNKIAGECGAEMSSNVEKEAVHDTTEDSPTLSSTPSKSQATPPTPTLSNPFSAISADGSVFCSRELNFTQPEHSADYNNASTEDASSCTASPKQSQDPTVAGSTVGQSAICQQELKECATAQHWYASDTESEIETDGVLDQRKAGGELPKVMSPKHRTPSPVSGRSAAASTASCDASEFRYENIPEKEPPVSENGQSNRKDYLTPILMSDGIQTRPLYNGETIQSTLAEHEVIKSFNTSSCQNNKDAIELDIIGVSRRQCVNTQEHNNSVSRDCKIKAEFQNNLRSESVNEASGTTCRNCRVLKAAEKSQGPETNLQVEKSELKSPPRCTCKESKPGHRLLNDQTFNCPTCTNGTDDEGSIYLRTETDCKFRFERVESLTLNINNFINSNNYHRLHANTAETDTQAHSGGTLPTSSWPGSMNYRPETTFLSGGTTVDHGIEKGNSNSPPDLPPRSPNTTYQDHRLPREDCSTFDMLDVRNPCPVAIGGVLLQPSRSQRFDWRSVVCCIPCRKKNATKNTEDVDSIYDSIPVYMD